MGRKTESKLIAYMAGATALLSAGPSLADIVYVDVNPDHGVGMAHNTQVNEYYNIMLNGDTLYRIGNYHGYVSSSWLRNELWVENGQHNGTDIQKIAITGSYFTDPYLSSNNGYLGKAFSMGSLIGASQQFDSDAWLGVVSYWTSGTSTGGVGQVGDFITGTDKYAGIQFKLNGNTHYGWLRFNVAASLNGFSFFDYAYQDVPNVPINAGESNDDLPEDNISLSATQANGGYYPQDITLNMVSTSHFTVSQYRVFVVKQSAAASFSVNTARNLDSTHYFSVDTTSLNWQQALTGQTIDSDGDALVSGQGYVAIALIYPDGANANAVVLSQPSAAFLTTTDGQTDVQQQLPSVRVQGKDVWITHANELNAIRVFDLHGAMVYNATGSINTRISLPAIASGSYLVEMVHNGQSITQKVIIQ